MRHPSKHVDRQNRQIQAYQVRVHCHFSVFFDKDEHLDNAQARNPQKRPERAPFRKENEENDPDQATENDQSPPAPVAGQTEPKQTERRGDPFSALELHRNGENMPDDDKKSAKITDKIRNGNAALEHVISVHEKEDHGRNTALERIANKGEQAYFQAEFSAHIHRTGITAADGGDIPFFLAGDQTRKVKAPYQITKQGDQKKLPPVLRKIENFHNVVLKNP